MDFIKSQFSDEAEYQKSVAETIGANFLVFEELEAQYEKPFNRRATVDFSFISNSLENLNKLNTALNLKFTCIGVEEGEVDPNIFLKRWLVKEQQVEIQKINEWVFQLLVLGQENDCLFNGWGLYPEGEN
jgi:regulator of RNase E activity RraB